jgi:hypothetical protein
MGRGEISRWIPLDGWAAKAGERRRRRAKKDRERPKKQALDRRRAGR